MPRKGENIYKRKDGRWEGRYIKSKTAAGTTSYGYCYGKSYKEVKEKLRIHPLFELAINGEEDWYYPISPIK